MVFTQLTVVTPDGQVARRRCAQTDLRSPKPEKAADINAVIDIFSARRLLVLGQDSVEISHDVLLQAWKQLRDWLGDDQLDRALYSQVVTDADTWDATAGTPPSCTGRAARHFDSATARWQIAPARYPPLPRHRPGVPARRSPRARRGIRRRRAVIAGSGPDRGRRQRRRDRRTQCRQRRRATRHRPVSPACRAKPCHRRPGDRAAAGGRRLASLSHRPSPTRHDNLADRAATRRHPAHPTLAWARWRSARTASCWPAAGGDGTVRLWNPATGQPVGTPLPAATGLGLGVTAVAFSPDGKLLASAGERRHRAAVEPGHRAARRRPPSAPPARGGVTGVAFSPDGRLLTSVGADGTVRLWNPATGKAPQGSPPWLKYRPGGAACSEWRSAGTAGCWPAPGADGTRPDAGTPGTAA